MIPDNGRLTEDQAHKFQTFIDQGGRLVLSHESGMALHEDRFYFQVGRVAGRSEYDPEYIQVRDKLIKQDTDDVLVESAVVIPGKSVTDRCPTRRTPVDLYPVR